jgi:hypothetical protein
MEESSARARKIFDAAARRDLHLALVQLPCELFPRNTWTASTSAANSKTPNMMNVTCLRSVLMKPEHLAWLDAIWDRLHSAAEEELNHAS